MAVLINIDEVAHTIRLTENWKAWPKELKGNV